VREQPQHLAELPVGHAAAAQLGGDAGREGPVRTQVGVVVGDEGVIGVVAPPRARRSGAELMGQGQAVRSDASPSWAW
jgi:hypothetical protein